MSVISTIVLISASLDTVQEFRAEQAAEHLKRSVALREQVRRDGRETSLPSADLVPGDVVLLASGDLVPADGRVIEARDFFVNEALLTGEPYPQQKRSLDGVAGAEIIDAVNAAFMGSSVMSGSAHILICTTGAATELGRISSGAAPAPPRPRSKPGATGLAC